MGVLGLALLVVGIVGGRAFTANFELDTAGKVRKGVGVAAAVVGALLLLRGLGLVGAPVHSGSGTVEWRTDLAAAEAEARSTGRALMVDFSAEWCKACKELEAHTFSADEVAPELSKWITVRVDMTQDQPEHAAMRARFGIQGLPTVAFIDAKGQWLTNLTLNGAATLSSGTYTFTVTAPQTTATLRGTLSGSGVSFVKEGLGTLLLSGTLIRLLRDLVACFFKTYVSCLHGLLVVALKRLLSLFNSRIYRALQLGGNLITKLSKGLLGGIH
jgi:thiol-disulfide isomerase/thioredoxin